MNRKDILNNLDHALGEYKSAQLFVDNEDNAQYIVNIVKKIDALYYGLFDGIVAPSYAYVSKDKVMRDRHAYDADYERAKKYADVFRGFVNDVEVKKTFSLIESLKKELQNTKDGIKGGINGITEGFIDAFVKLKYALGDLFVDVVGESVEIVMNIMELVDTLENKISEVLYNAYKMPLHESKLPEIETNSHNYYYYPVDSSLRKIRIDFRDKLNDFYAHKLNHATKPADFYYGIKGCHFHFIKQHKMDQNERFHAFQMARDGRYLPDTNEFYNEENFYSRLIEKIFALIPYKEEHMKSKLPLKIMENIFEYAEILKKNRFKTNYDGKQDYEGQKKVYICLLASIVGTFLTPAILRSPRANMEFRTSLSIEELTDNFEKNLSNLKQIASKLSEKEKLTPAEKDICSKLSVLDNNLFTYDWATEINKDYDKVKFKEAKRLAKNNDRYKDAEYILAVRKLQAKYLGMEYDEKLAGGIAKRKLLEK